MAWLLFSFDLNGDDSRGLLRVRQNSLSVDELQFWDFRLNTRGNHLIARRRKGDIFLDLHITHVTISELEELATGWKSLRPLTVGGAARAF